MVVVASSRRGCMMLGSDVARMPSVKRDRYRSPGGTNVAKDLRTKIEVKSKRTEEVPLQPKQMIPILNLEYFDSR